MYLLLALSHVGVSKTIFLNMSLHRRPERLAFRGIEFVRPLASKHTVRREGGQIENMRFLNGLIGCIIFYCVRVSVASPPPQKRVKFSFGKEWKFFVTTGFWDDTAWGGKILVERITRDVRIVYTNVYIGGGTVACRTARDDGPGEWWPITWVSGGGGGGDGGRVKSSAALPTRCAEQ